jgi:TonB family protein
LIELFILANIKLRMTRIAAIFILLFYIHVSALAQKSISSATNYYNSGVEMLQDGDFRSADSLFSLSLDIFPDVDAYFNRALARKKLGDEAGFCADIFMSTANGDTVSRNIFFNKCTVNDTVYLDSDDKAVNKIVSVKTKIIAKRRYDSNTDIITIDSLGKLNWDYEVDSTNLSKIDSLSYYFVEQMPSFPGGEEALVKFLAHNIKYPPKARENGYQGSVFLTFVIGKEGNVRDVKILKGVETEIDREAMRVVRGMPQWFPGMQKGRFVNVQYNLPIRFTLHQR